MPYNLGPELKRDFPHLMRARYENFGRGGGRGGGRGAPPAIPRSQCITNASAVDKARGEAAREREATAKAEERAEKTRQRFLKSQEALFNSQKETDAAKKKELSEAMRGIDFKQRQAQWDAAYEFWCNNPDENRDEQGVCLSWKLRRDRALTAKQGVGKKPELPGDRPGFGDLKKSTVNKPSSMPQSKAELEDEDDDECSDIMWNRLVLARVSNPTGI